MDEIADIHEPLRETLLLLPLLNCLPSLVQEVPRLVVFVLLLGMWFFFLLSLGREYFGVVFGPLGRLVVDDKIWVFLFPSVNFGVKLLYGPLLNKDLPLPYLLHIRRHPQLQMFFSDPKVNKGSIVVEFCFERGLVVNEAEHVDEELFLKFIGFAIGIERDEDLVAYHID